MINAEISTLRGLLGELYQVLGVYDAPAHIMDQVSAAANGEKLPYESLLPFYGNNDSAKLPNMSFNSLIKSFFNRQLISVEAEKTLNDFADQLKIHSLDSPEIFVAEGDLDNPIPFKAIKKSDILLEWKNFDLAFERKTIAVLSSDGYKLITELDGHLEEWSGGEIQDFIESTIAFVVRYDPFA